MWLSADKQTESQSDTSRVRHNGQNGIHVKLCRLASEKHRIGPNICLRSNLIAPKFFWGSMPPGILGYAFLQTHYQSDHSKSDGYGPSVLKASVAHLAATQYVLSELHLGLTGKFSLSGKTPKFIYFQLEARYSEHLEWENHSAWVLSWQWEFSSCTSTLNGSLIHYQGSREASDMSWLHKL